MDKNELDKSRAEFEAWAEIKNAGTMHDVIGWYYFDEITQGKWEAWQAALARAGSEAPTAAEEPSAPALLEALSWHAAERDDLTLEEAVEAIRNGYKTIRQRTDRQMLLQLAWLMSATPIPQKKGASEQDAPKLVGQVVMYPNYSTVIHWAEGVTPPAGTKLYSIPDRAAMSAAPIPQKEGTSEQDAKDAARYRFLRDTAPNVYDECPVVFTADYPSLPEWDDMLNGKTLDKTIDQAMSAAQAQPKDTTKEKANG